MSSLPIIALIGATGQTGKHALLEALSKGYQVRALARNPDQLSSSPNLTVIKGDINDEAALIQLIEGTQAVVSCFGTVDRKNYVVEKGIRTIVKVIKATDNQSKLIHISAVGLGHSRQYAKGLGWYLTLNVIFPMIGTGLFKDMEIAEQVMKDEPALNYVIARAAVLSNKDAQGYQAVRKQTGKLMVSRADVAAFMVNAVGVTDYDQKAMSVFAK